MQALYQADTTGDGMNAVFEELSEREDYLAETVDFAKELASGAWKQKEAADKSITKLSKDWSIERMGKVVLGILRLAIYEIEYKADTPRSVIINEAVELAKKFSTPEAAKFVNGILGAYLKERS